MSFLDLPPLPPPPLPPPSQRKTIMENWQIEWGKLALILVLMLGGFGLVFVALLDGDLSDDRFAITLALGSSIITGVMGYLFGNGRLASKGMQSVPTIAARQPTNDQSPPV